MNALRWLNSRTYHNGVSSNFDCSDVWGIGLQTQVVQLLANGNMTSLSSGCRYLDCPVEVQLHPSPFLASPRHCSGSVGLRASRFDTEFFLRLYWTLRPSLVQIQYCSALLTCVTVAAHA